MKNLLEIKNLHVRLNKDLEYKDKEILKGVNFKMAENSIQAVMGPNGSGKSTLAQVIMGDPSYSIHSGSVEFLSKDITNLSVTKKALMGLFLSFQHPVEVPGVNVGTFLHASYKAIHKIDVPIFEFARDLRKLSKELGINDAFIARNLNEGFSGGEKKRLELLQMAVLKPKLAILDEIDSGLDVDGLMLISQGIKKLKEEGTSFLIITHTKRIIEKLDILKVSIMVNGKIVQEGDVDLAYKIDKKGYKNIVYKET